MSAEAIATLLMPFEKGIVPMPGAGRAHMLRADLAPGLDAAWSEGLVVEQTWKPAADRLARAGFRTLEEAGLEDADGYFDVVMVPISKDRAETLGMIERGWRRLATGGTLLVCGAKGDGIQAIERQLADLVPLAGTLPKHGCRVSWVTKAGTPTAFEAELRAWAVQDMPRVLVDDAYVSRPGLFSWDRIDPGSVLLARHLPADLKGAVADFGCGFGYLSVELARRFPKITSLTSMDAERRATECTAANLSTLAGSSTVATKQYWIDLSRPLGLAHRYDAVVTNPPFHDGRIGDPGIGQAFIATAHAALKPGGRLVMVANRHLPYEATLQKHFGGHQVTAEDARYKVLLARR